MSEKILVSEEWKPADEPTYSRNEDEWRIWILNQDKTTIAEVFGDTSAEVNRRKNLICASREMAIALMEMLAAAREVNRAAGETVFNPAAFQLAQEALFKAVELRA